MLEYLATGLVVAWGVLTVQTIVNLLAFRTLSEASAVPTSRVSIVIPARNEERYIGRTIDAALAQDFPDFDVVIVDDESTDGTADAIARRASDARLVPVSSRPLEPGWLGKPNALATGAAKATGKWILFMDADVELHPLALRDSVAACERGGWDHLALLPHFERKGFWEELLMPVIPVVALIYIPSFLAHLPRTRMAAGGGAFGLVRREAYEAMGGHENLKGSVVDDVRLAMDLKAAGFVSASRAGMHRLRLRMYHGLDEFVEGFTKNAHAGFGRSVWKPVVAVVVSLWIGIAPFAWPVLAALQPASAFSGAVGALGASLLLLLVSRALVHLRLGFPLWPIVFSPIATFVTLFIVLRSLRMARGDGVVRWRGREYPHETTEF
jgi:hypothetical protein